MTRWSPKDPLDKRNYWYDFAPMIPTDTTVTAATVTIAAAQHPLTGAYTDLVKTSDDILDGTWVVILVEGGVPGASAATKFTNKYDIQYHITISTGEEFDLTKTLEVKERIQA